jgi:hypothetical protein
MIATAKCNFERPFFFEVFATAAWKQRNALIFDNLVSQHGPFHLKETSSFFLTE